MHRTRTNPEVSATSNNQDVEVLDGDVIAESERVKSGAADDDLVLIKDLTKRYDTGKLAVNHLNLGVRPGECFGLLGINGAGKTSTLAMLTAEFPPTSGDAFLSGVSVTHNPELTRKNIGYCPQFDAHFANMTGREHVKLYASIKGLPASIIDAAVQEKLEEVGLSSFDSDRLSSNYSGGMKRKLSVACATIGNPSTIFLDESSTGMDPVARRELWKVINRMVSGERGRRTSIILTTHSMEECEALCPRIGIMAGGQLRCLGSAQHLKSRFGRGFQVEGKVKEVLLNDSDYKKNLISLLEHFNAPTDGTGQDLFINLNDALRAVEAISQETDIVNMITEENPIGYVIYKDASSAAGVALDELCFFITAEMRIKNLEWFFNDSFDSALLRERQERKVRYEVASKGLRIASIFEIIEENKNELQLSDYGVSQTSLEQIFNQFAREAEERKAGTID